jgi:transcriptional regulator with XRE-family HTH domain
VKEARKARGLTQRELAELLSDREYPTDRTTVVRIENGQKTDVSLSDVFAFALALDVRPMDLMVPLDDEAPIAVTPARVIPARKARAWIRGDALLRGADWMSVFRQRPKSEQRALIEAELARDLNMLERALMQETLKERVEIVMRALEALSEAEQPKGKES